MDMPARTYSSPWGGGLEGARYGFNGKEWDKDIHSLTAYDYGFRIYNPAIGKFLSVDPLTDEYPWYTPYQYAGNKPIRFIDRDGLEESEPVSDIWNARGDLLTNAGWAIQDFFDGKGPVYRAMDYFNREVNPAGIVIHDGYQMVAGKDLLGDESKYRGRLGAFTHTGVNVIMYLSGEKFFQGFNTTPALEAELNFNKSAIGSATIQEGYQYGEQWGTAASYSVEDRTTTVLGTADGYLPTRINSTQNIVANEANPGGFCFFDPPPNLPINFNTAAGRQNFWENFNRPFLDKIIERGDRIVLTDNPFDQMAIFFRGEIENGLNFFGREIQYLQEKGYTFIDGEATPPVKK